MEVILDKKDEQKKKSKSKIVLLTVFLFENIVTEKIMNVFGNEIHFISHSFYLDLRIELVFKM